MVWIAEAIKAVIILCVRIVVYILAFNIITEIFQAMSETMKTISDVAGNPKTQGTVSLLAGGTWAYDSVMDAASDLLVIVSLVSGLVAIVSYFAGRNRRKLQRLREDEEHAERMESIRKEKEAAQAKIDLMTEIMRHGQDSMYAKELTEKVVSLDAKHSRKQL